MKKIKTTECDKLADVKEKSQSIGEFVEWLTTERLVEFCVRNDRSDRLMPFHFTIEKLLAEFFNIDLDKVEKEKQAILDDFRNRHNVQ